MGMSGEAAGGIVCALLWVVRAYVRLRYRVRYKVGRKVRVAWRRGTPDWITRLMPWLVLLSWSALIVMLYWALLRVGFALELLIFGEPAWAG